MQSNTLAPKTPRATSARVGRGGKRGKTSGRGTKGQKARAGRKLRPEMRDLIKKLPKRRGHGKNRARTVRVKDPMVPVNLSALDKACEAGDTLTPAVFVRKGLVKLKGGRVPAIKLLGNGTLTKKLSISGVHASAAAKAAIEAAGGSVIDHA